MFCLLKNNISKFEQSIYIYAHSEIIFVYLLRYTKLPDAVQWGVDNEDNARADYIQLNKMVNDDFSVEPTGLTLCSTRMVSLRF